jgi:hypothetical protein
MYGRDNARVSVQRPLSGSERGQSESWCLVIDAREDLEIGNDARLHPATTPRAGARGGA